MSIGSALGLPKQRDSSGMKTSKAAAVMQSWCDRMKTHRDLNAPSDSHGMFPGFWYYVEDRETKMEDSKRQSKTSHSLVCLGNRKTGITLTSLYSHSPPQDICQSLKARGYEAGTWAGQIWIPWSFSTEKMETFQAFSQKIRCPCPKGRIKPERR